jgi:hypothetical protein
MLKWESPPTLVFIVKKPNDPHVTQCFKQVVEWFLVKKKVTVMVEAHVINELPELELVPFTQGTHFHQFVPKTFGVISLLH